MSKQEMLMEFTVQDLVERLTQELQIDYDEAMKILYASETFDKLNDSETGLYLDGSDYVYGLLADELRAGRFVQNEI